MVFIGNGLTINAFKCSNDKFSLRHGQHLNTLLKSHGACTIIDSFVNPLSIVIYLVVSFSFDLSLSSHNLMLSTNFFA